MLVLKLREMVGWLYEEKQTEIFGKRKIIWRNGIVCTRKKKKKKSFLNTSRYENAVWDSQGEVLLQVAAVPQQPRPQLHADDAEDEEDEEAEQQHVAEHGQRVEQQVHQDAHACVCRK